MGYKFNWKEEHGYQEAYEEVDTFFENLYHHNYDDSINTIDYGNLIYREGQNGYTLDIMEAIKNNQILLIQAEVGLGKSFGYLLPIFFTQKKVKKFKKVVISTSSIALQQQLLMDIHRISQMLNIPLTASIAKGINNYACLRKIEHYLNSNYTSPNQKLVLQNIRNKIEELNSSDREDLKIISEQIWKEVQLKGRGFCSNCTYSKRCPFYQKQLNQIEHNILITNHANFMKNIIEDGELVRNVDMFVFDEAHKLEENMRNIRQGSLQLKEIHKLIDQVKNSTELTYRNGIISSIEDEYHEVDSHIEELKKNLEKLFSSIRRISSINFSKLNNNNHSIVDCDRLNFHYTNAIMDSLTHSIQGFDFLFNEISNFENKMNCLVRSKEVEGLKQVQALLKDMLQKEKSLNIYWASFFKENRINLCYAPKSNQDISNSIFQRNIPIICTSGTLLDNKNSYHYFQSGINLDGLKNRTIVQGESYSSPFNYKENALLYYNPNLVEPSYSNEYITSIALEIKQLLQATKGKALILFTSKKVMNQVYKIISQEDFSFPLLLQTDTNTKEIKQVFKQNIDSCLFATGAFWEGIDIKGAALSNLIITHLPFQVVDAINQYKASKYKAKYEQFNEVYIPQMLIQLKQGVGRAIRSSTDKAIISCLDSRIVNYLDVITKHLPIPLENYTTDLNQVQSFSKEKILTLK